MTDVKPAEILEQEVPAPGRQETILFVDDEPNLRSLASAVLEAKGYRALLAADGMEALKVFAREQGNIDLVVLDLTMPRLSGEETLGAIRAMNDRVPILIASGFSRDQLTLKERQEIAGFIAKPYRPHELATVVREMLDRREQSPG
jgi:DNA-binding response OmpR family regulator